MTTTPPDHDGGTAATAADVLRLIKHVQDEVKRKLGYTLETEIAVIGEL